MKKIYRVGVICIVGCLIFAGAYRYRCHRLQTDLAERILRFHVIANSDTKEDQDLKLKVRDEIGAYLGEELSEVKDLEECEKVVNRHLTEIEHCAERVIASEDYDYSVEAFVSDSDFPKKTYGSFTFPGGTYHALKVVIGNGTGKNWWCVMYPNLCFSSSVYEVIDDNSKEELQAVLSEEDYAEIMAEGKLKVKFKYLDALLSLFEK